MRHTRRRRGPRLAVGRRIGLNIVVLPATGPTAAPDPVFVLAGGPGLGAASLVTGDTARSMAAIRRERDLVFVDQRGTGKSSAHGCRFGGVPTMRRNFNDLFPMDGVRACRQRLDAASPTARRRHCNTCVNIRGV